MPQLSILIFIIVTAIQIVRAGEYMVYPWSREDKNTNDKILQDLSDFLKKQDVQTVGDDKRGITDFWLVQATEEEVQEFVNGLAL